jgi:Tol biopolymer transport system component
MFKKRRESMKNTKAIFYIFAVLLFFMIGCGPVTRTVAINSIPEGSEVRSTADKNGPQDFFIGKTPLNHLFAFDSSLGPMMYNLEFRKPGYAPKVIAIKYSDTQQAVKVTLDKEMVKEVQKYVVVVSEDKGYILEPRKVRAWVEDIEREGMAASSIVRLAENQSIIGMTLSPSGETLYFSLAEPIKDERGEEKVMANLRSINSTGGGVTLVTSGQWLDANPTITADGKFLIFSSNRIQNNKPDLFRISTEKTGGIAVIRQTVEGANYHPSAAKTNLIAFVYRPKYLNQFSGTEQIWTIGGDAEYPTQLRNGSMPALSPDAKTIAFIGDDRQLWKMPSTGQNPVQLTSDKINKDGKKNPTWSPDGNYIIYVSDVGKDSKDVANNDIWLIPSEGGVAQQLTTNGSDDDYPVVSPDQKHIYFVSNRGFKEGIWRIPFPKTDTAAAKK